MIAAQIIYLLILATSMILHLMLMVYAWRNRATSGPSVRLFLAMVFFNFQAVVTFLLLQLSPTAEDTLVWARLRFLGLAFPPVLMFMFALDFAGLGQRISRKWLFPVYVIPVATALISWLSPVPGLMFRSWKVEQFNLLQLERVEFGEWYIVHAVYSYLMVACGMIVFSRGLPRMAAPFRSRVLALIGAVALVILFSFLSTFRLLPRELPNPLPIMVTLMSILVAWVAFRLRLIDMMPAAHYAVVQQMGDGVIVVDSNNRIVEVNPAAQQMLDLPAKQIIGQPAHRVLQTQNTTDQPDRPDVNVLTTSDRVIQLVHNPSHYYEFRIAPLRTATYQALGHIITLRDVTERRKAEEEREQLIDTLDGYAHMVAHDLKNPIGTLLVYAELLKWELNKAEGVSEKAYQQLTQIKKGSKRLSRIIDELLIFARLRGSQEIRTTPVNMADLITDLLVRLEENLTSAQAALTVADDIPPAIGYAPWIEEVLMNYISNAIKYGGTPPCIHIGADRIGKDVKFWVRDNRLGLTATEQQQLFGQFARLERHQKVTGNGLGLSIAREIVERLGGQVGVRSTPGEGSLFYFTLPAALTPNVAQSAAPVLATGETAAQP